MLHSRTGYVEEGPCFHERWECRPLGRRRLVEQGVKGAVIVTVLRFVYVLCDLLAIGVGTNVLFWLLCGDVAYKSIVHLVRYIFAMGVMGLLFPTHHLPSPHRISVLFMLHVRRVDPCLAKGSFRRSVVFDLRIVHNHDPLSERRCRSCASRKMPVTLDDVGSGKVQIYFGFRTRHRHSVMRRSWNISC